MFIADIKKICTSKIICTLETTNNIKCTYHRIKKNTQIQQHKHYRIIKSINIHISLSIYTPPFNLIFLEFDHYFSFLPKIDKYIKIICIRKYKRVTHGVYMQYTYHNYLPRNAYAHTSIKKLKIVVKSYMLKILKI